MTVRLFVFVFFFFFKQKTAYEMRISDWSSDVCSSDLASLRGVRKQYGKVVALDGVDLAIAPGQVLALLGANGAGKSTAIALLLGLVRPDAGQALLSGQ